MTAENGCKLNEIVDATVSERQTPKMEVQLENAWDSLAAALKSVGTECPAEFEDVEGAAKYLRLTLGEDWLEKIQKISKHPFLGLMGPRIGFLDWIACLQRVSQCPNFQQVLRDLELATKSAHAYSTIRLCGSMRQYGFEIDFEPEFDNVDFEHRPDARVIASTGEMFYLEFSCQSLANNQLTAFEAMAACREPVRRYFDTLKCTYRLRTIPAPKHLEEIVRMVEETVQEVLKTGCLKVLEVEPLEMAICPQDKGEELKTWCNEHGLRPDHNEGPQDDTDELSRLKQKLMAKQRQLPSGYANLLAIENNYFFNHHPNVLKLITELQEELYKYPNVTFLLLHGSNGESRPLRALAFTHGEHRFQRHIRDGQVTHALLCLNRFADVKPSAKLVDLLFSSLFVSSKTEFSK